MLGLSERITTLGFYRQKKGSEQESGRMCILRGFLKTRIFVFSIVRRRHLHEMSRIARFAVETTLRGTYGGFFTESCR
jgi:hypothetical protein